MSKTKRSNTEPKKLTEISFHSMDAKRRFVAENAISTNEIYCEGSSSLSLWESADSTIDWTKNGWVYSVHVIV